MNWNPFDAFAYTRLILRDPDSFNEKLESAKMDHKYDKWTTIPIPWYLDDDCWEPTCKKHYRYGFKKPSFYNGGTVLFVTIRKDPDSSKPVEMILLSELDGRTWAVPVEYAEWFSPV